MPTPERVDLCRFEVDGAPCLLTARHTGEHISILTPAEDEPDEVDLDDEESDEDGDDEE